MANTYNHTLVHMYVLICFITERPRLPSQNSAYYKIARSLAQNYYIKSIKVHESFITKFYFQGKRHESRKFKTTEIWSYMVNLLIGACNITLVTK